MSMQTRHDARPPRAYRDQGGFTMMEVLIALLVLSIGLLGLAGLQLSAVRANNQAYWHSQAAWLAYDMADRLRANPDGVAAGHYDAIDTSSGPADPGCIATGCNAQEMAELDAFEWDALLDGLPAGQGTVVVAGDVYTVTVLWDEAGTGATGTACGTDPTVDLSCYAIEVEL